jgi:hypothetical protein
VGAGNVKKIITAGFDTVPKILAMTATDFLQVAGFKEKMAAKVKASMTDKIAQATLAELEDAILYSVFPNTQIWAGFGSNIVYRVIPDGDNQESCLFDVMILGRYAEGAETPAAAKLTRLADDAPFSDAPEIGALGAVFDQDMRNLPYMMKGLKASKKGKVSLASYQESRIRHHHITLDKYLGLAEVR